MTIKVYCLKYPDDIGTNPEMTLNFEKAMEWLNNNKQYKCEVLEFIVSNERVSDLWERCWFYHRGELHKLIAGEYFD